MKTKVFYLVITSLIYASCFFLSSSTVKAQDQGDFIGKGSDFSGGGYGGAIRANAGSNLSGGGVILQSGGGGYGTVAGNVLLTTGGSYSRGGDIILNAGGAYGKGGDLKLSAGSAVRECGNIILTLDSPPYASTKGKVIIDTGSENNAVFDYNGNLMIRNDVNAHSFIAEEGIKANGIIEAREVKVVAQPADFVFEDDYNLRDLDQVEAFIKEHKHLPDIPGAAEMEVSGVNLAEMNKLLLQKIEELTLYSISKEKKIKILHDMNQNHVDKVEKLEERLAKLEQVLLQEEL